MTNLTMFVLSMAGADGVPVQLSTCGGAEAPLFDDINAIAKALTIVKFRGTVTFTITTTNGVLYWTVLISYTDDIPNGVWNTVDEHPLKPGSKGF